MSKTILLRGPLIVQSGYGVHARQVARWLFDVAAKNHDIEVVTELLPWGQCPWYTDTDAENGLIGRIIQASIKKQPFYDMTIQIQLPNEWNPLLGMVNVGITAGVETSKCNPAWIDCINRMQLVITPSEFTKQTFLNSGAVTTPISVVPESYFDKIKEQDSIKPFEIPNLETDFNFLVHGQLTGNNPENDRKNIPYTIKWLSEVFSGRSDIGVVLKTSLVRQTALDRIMVTNLFNKMLMEIKTNPVGPRFYLLHGTLSEEELIGLYRHPKIKCLASLTRGEGWNLVALEAAACGLPVMITNWSAHTEFLNLGNFIKVDYRLDKIHPSRVDKNIFVPEAEWAYPSELDFKRRAVKFVNSPEMPKEWAKDLQKKILEGYSFEKIAEKLSQELDSFFTS